MLANRHGIVHHMASQIAPPCVANSQIDGNLSDCDDVAKVRLAERIQDVRLVERVHDRLHDALKEFKTEMLDCMKDLFSEHTRLVLSSYADDSRGAPSSSRLQRRKTRGKLESDVANNCEPKEHVGSPLQLPNTPDGLMAVLPDASPRVAPPPEDKSPHDVNIPNEPACMKYPDSDDIKIDEYLRFDTEDTAKIETQAMESKCRELMVTVLGATGLANADKFSKSDPYCVCKLVNKDESNFTTPVVKDDDSPMWNYQGFLRHYEQGDELEITVYDRDIAFDDFLGSATVSHFPFYGTLNLSGPGAAEGSTVTIDAVVAKPRRSSRINSDTGVMMLLNDTRSSSFLGIPKLTRLTLFVNRLVSYRSPRVKRMLSRRDYNVYRTALLFADGCLILWQTEDAASKMIQGKDIENVYIFAAMCMLFVLFATDSSLRVIGGHFPSPLWSLFNVFALCTYVLQIAVTLSEQGTEQQTFEFIVTLVSKARAIRLWQFIQVSQNLLQFQIFVEMNVMMRSLRLTFMTALSCFLMLASFLVIVSVLIVTGVTHFCNVPNASIADTADDLIDHFGTIPRACLSLFKAISGGDDWGNFLDALQPLPFVYSVLFLLFMFYSVFAFMNIIIGTMVESILAAAKSDQQMMVNAEKENKKEFLRNMAKIFKAVDSDNSGGISLLELQQHMEDVDVCAYFAALGVDAGQVSHLFSLLDDDDSGTITRDEFLKGVLRLRGEAKSLDIAIVLYEMESMRDEIEELGRVLRFSMSSVASHGRGTSKEVASMTHAHSYTPRLTPSSTGLNSP
eukprot:TRINITY_DN8154_c0_g1_i1.p1 TRINITY_DN8154_c0_g1~~TRINITY_DN8154_c0_g1_i1.p1  ORF type:complete len:799 (+),score=89.63 TRINITY_DN8154_c0_g1_i1:22-2397(+)